MKPFPVRRGDYEDCPVKHLRCISALPGQAQTTTVSLAAVFTLIADILAAVGQAVLTKESQEFPTLPTGS